MKLIVCVSLAFLQLAASSFAECECVPLPWKPDCFSNCLARAVLKADPAVIGQTLRIDQEDINLVQVAVKANSGDIVDALNRVLGAEKAKEFWFSANTMADNQVAILHESSIRQPFLQMGPGKQNIQQLQAHEGIEDAPPGTLKNVIEEIQIEQGLRRIDG